MKKIILTLSLSIFSLISISCKCKGPIINDYYYYIRSNPNNSQTLLISLRTQYELPKHRETNFVDTLLIMLSNSSVNRNGFGLNFFEAEYDENKQVFNARFYDENNKNVDVAENASFSESITDETSKNYYSDFIEFGEYHNYINGEENKVINNTRIYLRQTENNEISYMVMVENKNANLYEYLFHTEKGRLVVDKYQEGYDEVDLPDILK